jgi:putative endonuclease
MTRLRTLYCMASWNNNAIYIGVTTDLVRRVAEHKLGLGGGHTARYKCQKLVYYETGTDMYEAIKREKQLQNWRRSWKDELITQFNPTWRDLAWDIGLTPSAVTAYAQQLRHTTPNVVMAAILL